LPSPFLPVTQLRSPFSIESDTESRIAGPPNAIDTSRKLTKAIFLFLASKTAKRFKDSICRELP
jgi:hypothetical protein